MFCSVVKFQYRIFLFMEHDELFNMLLWLASRKSEIGKLGNES